MELKLTDRRERLQEKVRGFSQAVLRPTSTQSGADAKWLEQMWAEAADSGLTELADNRNGTATELPDMMVVVEEIAYGDGSLAVILVERYLCYRAASLSPHEELQRSITESLAGCAWNGSPVLLWPDAYDNRWLAEQRGDAEPLSDPLIASGGRLHGASGLCRGAGEARLFLGWGDVLIARKRCGVVFLLAPGRDQNIAIQPACCLGLESLSYHRVVFDLKQEADGFTAYFPATEAYRKFHDQLFRERLFLTAATLLGLARAALDYALDYSRQRVTFGKTISQHQAVALKLADMAIALEALHLTLHAASQTQQPDDMEQVWCLWRNLGEATLEVATNAVRILGGHGYLKLHPVEKWLRDIQFLRLSISDPDWQPAT